MAKIKKKKHAYKVASDVCALREQGFFFLKQVYLDGDKVSDGDVDLSNQSVKLFLRKPRVQK